MGIRLSRYLWVCGEDRLLFPEVADEVADIGGYDDYACYKEAQYKCHTDPERTKIKDAFHNASGMLKCIGNAFSINQILNLLQKLLLYEERNLAASSLLYGLDGLATFVANPLKSIGILSSCRCLRFRRNRSTIPPVQPV